MQLLKENTIVVQGNYLGIHGILFESETEICEHKLLHA